MMTTGDPCAHRFRHRKPQSLVVRGARTMPETPRLTKFSTSAICASRIVLPSRPLPDHLDPELHQRL